MLVKMHSTTDAPRRKRNPRGQGHLLRAQLLEAASELLAAGTAESELSLRRVARQAGVAATSVYRHFANLEELLWGVTEVRFRELDERMNAAAAGATSPAQELRARALAYCAHALEEPAHYRVLFGLRRVEKEPRPFHALPGAPVFAQLEGSVRRALATAGREPDDAFFATTLLWCALHGIVSMRTDKPQFPWPALETLVDRAIAAITGPLANPVQPKRTQAPPATPGRPT
jgi:AcrR family transcriptional regulator